MVEGTCASDFLMALTRVLLFKQGRNFAGVKFRGRCRTAIMKSQKFCISILPLLHERMHPQNLNPQNIYAIEEHTATTNFYPVKMSRYTVYQTTVKSHSKILCVVLYR